MKANILNIQKTYSEIPGTWEFEGVTHQGYEHFTDLHFVHGWRDVVIPTITETQKLSNDFILVDDIVTKEVIELNELELQAIEDAKIPSSVSNIQIRKALIKFGIMPSSITTMLYALPQKTQEEKIKKELLINMWEYEDEMFRKSPDIISFGARLGVDSKKLNQLFTLANTL